MATVPSAFQPYVVSISGLSYATDSDEYGLPDMRWWGAGSVTLSGRIKVRVKYSTKQGAMIDQNDYIIESGQTRTFSNPSGQDMVVFLLETVSAEVYACPHCGLTFSIPTDLDAHIIAEHPTVPPPPPGKFTWNGCKLAFAFGFNPGQLKAAGFNTGGCYTSPSDALLDECLAKGLWLIPDLHWYFLKDSMINLSGAINFVNRWKHHPAVAAWYFLDEPDIKSSKYNESAQQGWYDALKAADPNHDFLTAFTAHLGLNGGRRHWNPNAFDHVCFDAYPYHVETPNWESRLRNSCNVCRNRSGGIGGMAVAQAFYNGGNLNPTGIVDDMLRVWQEYGIGTQKDGYGMYAWNGGPKTAPEDAALRVHITAVNAGYPWPHPSPEPALPPPPTYTCPHCGATFASQAELDTHIADEHTFVCPYCGAIFTSQADLDAHIASVHHYACPHCGATFITQTELDAHIASEHPTETFTTEDITCSQCGSTLRVTVSSISANNVSQNCPVCGLSGIAEGTEIEIIHAEPWPPPVYTCSHCGEVFGSQEELDIHVASEHPAPVYECPHCGLTFATQVELEAHVASEHPAAPVFTCLYCGAIFASQEDLNTHVASEHPIAAEPVPWYKRWQTYLLLGGVGTLITGIVIKKRKKK